MAERSLEYLAGAAGKEPPQRISTSRVFPLRTTFAYKSITPSEKPPYLSISEGRLEDYIAGIIDFMQEQGRMDLREQINTLRTVNGFSGYVVGVRLETLPTVFSDDIVVQYYFQTLDRFAGYKLGLRVGILRDFGLALQTSDASGDREVVTEVLKYFHGMKEGEKPTLEGYRAAKKEGERKEVARLLTRQLTPMVREPKSFFQKDYDHLASGPKDDISENPFHSKEQRRIRLDLENYKRPREQEFILTKIRQEKPFFDKSPPEILKNRDFGFKDDPLKEFIPLRESSLQKWMEEQERERRRKEAPRNEEPEEEIALLDWDKKNKK